MAMKILCPKCKHADIRFRISTDSYFCKYCGTITPKERMIVKEL